MHKLGVSIYDKLKTECAIHTNNKVDSLIGSTSDHASYLSLVDTVWTDHCDSMHTIRNIFLYLDRTVVSSCGVKNLWDLGVEQFKLRFEYQKEVEHKTIVSLLAAIDAERQGLSVDREMIRRILRMLTSIGSYVHRFEFPLLSESKRFFLSEGQNLIEKLEPASFLLHVERRLKEASEMVLRYLEISTRNPLFTVIEDNLLTPHVNQLVDRGFCAMLEGDKLVDLGRMYMLLEKVNGSSILKSQWSAHIRRIGEDLISDVDPERERIMVDELLKFQERMNSILKNSFNNHEGYRQVLKTSFEQFINSRQNRPAELLAKYVDKKLRGEKGLDDVNTELILEKAMSLFRLLNGKDIFEGFYKKLLAKRLLLNKYSSIDLEKSMITRLKTECGSGFTAKLEGMFLDIDLSRENSAKFIEYQNTEGHGKHIGEPDADIQVLTIGYWPAFPTSETVIVPPILTPIMTRYDNFFSGIYQGRR
jgi:cullin-4